MQKIKIFLASSAELDKDKSEFELFISKKNKELFSKRVFLELLTWKDYVSAMSQTRLQDEYNKDIAQCDICIILFHTKVGRYTHEEFDVAHEAFKKTSKPRIYTYFKNTEDSLTPEIKAFQEKIDGLNHFYDTYENTEDLYYKFNMQLEKLADSGLIKHVRIDAPKIIKYAVFGLLVPLLILFFAYKYIDASRPFQTTIQIYGWKGKEQKPLQGLGTIELKLGDKTEKADINSNGEAIFKQIHSKYDGEKAHISISGTNNEPYYLLDSVIILTKDEPIYVQASVNGLDRLKGQIIDGKTGEGLANATVSIQNIDAYTDEYGYFELSIPLEKQELEQEVNIFKQGYSSYRCTIPMQATGNDNDFRQILQPAK